MSYIKAYMVEPDFTNYEFYEMLETMKQAGWTVTRKQDKQYAETSWSYCDIQQLQPDMGREEAEKVLDKLEDDIADAMLQAGWQVIQDEIGDAYSHINNKTEKTK